MSSRTAEEISADDNLQSALRKVLIVYNRIPPGATLVSFTGVFEAMSYDGEKDTEYEHHGLIHMGGTERRSVARGNLEIGIERLNLDCQPCDDY